jgi:hypothetical protein
MMLKWIVLGYMLPGCLLIAGHAKQWLRELDACIEKYGRWPVLLALPFDLLIDVLLWPRAAWKLWCLRRVGGKLP